jgi:hypothetical protein
VGWPRGGRLIIFKRNSTEIEFYTFIFCNFDVLLSEYNLVVFTFLFLAIYFPEIH